MTHTHSLAYQLEGAAKPSTPQSSSAQEGGEKSGEDPAGPPPEHRGNKRWYLTVHAKFWLSIGGGLLWGWLAGCCDGRALDH